MMRLFSQNLFLSHLFGDIRWSLGGVGVLESLLFVTLRGNVILHFPLVAHLVLFCHVFKFAFFFW